MTKIENAIILAAGLGSRLKPLTTTLPKALLPLAGKALIDWQIEVLIELGIKDITIVVGHLKECFYDHFKDKPNIHILENPYPLTMNNITSLYIARNALRNTLVMDSDLLILDPVVLRTHIKNSCYTIAKTENALSEWYVTVKESRITQCFPDGLSKGYRLYGLSFWLEKDSELLKKYLATYIDTQVNLFWDTIPLTLHLNDFHLGINLIDETQLFEVDTLDDYELAKTLIIQRRL